MPANDRRNGPGVATRRARRQKTALFAAANKGAVSKKSPPGRSYAPEQAAKNRAFCRRKQRRGIEKIACDFFQLKSDVRQAFAVPVWIRRRPARTIAYARRWTHRVAS